MAGEPPMKKNRVDAESSGKVEMNFEKLETMFHHVQLYVDSIKDISEYKKLSVRVFNFLLNSNPTLTVMCVCLLTGPIEYTCK